MHCILRKLCNQLSRKRIDEKKLDIKRISLRLEDISYFNLSSNTVSSFTYEGKLFYFRECSPRLRFHEYFTTAVDRFFFILNRIWIHPEHFKQKIPIVIHFDDSVIWMFREYLNRLSRKSDFIRTLSHTNEISRKLRFSIWDDQSQTYTADFFCAFGLADLPRECYDIAIYFIWYMRGVAAAYRMAKLVRSRTHSYFSAVRSIASGIVANAIGLGHMIPETRLCRLEFKDGDSMLGVLSAAANGNRMADVNPTVDGSLQRELANLNILDLICFQPDHGVNNYNVYRENGEYRVCAFDNDNPNTFLPLPYIKRNFLGCSSVVNGEGRYNRPYIDQELYSKIENLDILSLKTQLKPYLNFIQIYSLIFRLKSLKNILKKSVADDHCMAIADHDWKQNTVADELSGQYGRTYLTIVEELRGK